MFSKLRDWLDDRTGYKKLVDALLIEHIPGGAKWRYVWGSCLAFVFAVQLITGVLLMTAYSPGESTAWSSVYFIQYQMDFGWFIRGLHHFGSQTMVVLLAVHMLQVVIAGAHLPPREVNWWLGLALLGAILGLSLTGYLLPWDQKGFWATQVATNIAGNLPVIGPWLQKVVVGGPAYGNQTLTHFYSLHVGILPPLVIVLIVLHLAVFRRQGVTTTKNATGEGWFWPDQAFRDMVASMLIFGVMIGLVLWGQGHKVDDLPSDRGIYDRMAHAGLDGKGANLDAPADASQPYPARPEWYFLFLFQLLKYFEGSQEIIGTVVIPNAVLVLLALLPFLGRGRMRSFGHAFGVLVVVCLLGGVGFLTYKAMDDDRAPSAAKFREEVEAAEQSAHRAIQLAQEGIPEDGAKYLLRRDPLTMGKRLFGTHCGTCHTHNDNKNDNPTASNLTGFGTKEWVRNLLRNPKSDDYFGHTKKLTAMNTWVKKARDYAKKKDKEKKSDDFEKQLDADFDTIAQWLGSHPRGDPPSKNDQSEFAKGYYVYADRCGTCHPYKGKGGKQGPDFNGYGDQDWVRLMIMAPHSKLRYGTHNAMPVFRDLEGPDAEIHRLDVQQSREVFLLASKDDDDQEKEAKMKQVEAATKLAHLEDVDRELILRWLLKDNRVVFGGAPISGARKK